MDYSLFEDAKCISMIYKEKMPDLQNVEIVKMVITPGEDAEIRITLDTLELPQNMPSKWLLQEINTVQLEIAFIGIELIDFNLTNGMNCHFAISNNKGRKHVRITNIADGKKISLDAKWIYVKQISAYIKQTSDEEQWI